MAGALQSSALPSPLEQWRSRLTTIILVAALVFAFPALIGAVSRATDAGMQVAYFGCYVVLAGLTVLERINHRVRIGAMIALGYAISLFATSHLGLSSSGRLILLSMPIFALLLIGRRAGMIAGVSSSVIFGAYTLASYRGWLPASPSTPDGWAWTQQGFMMAMLGVQLGLLVDRILAFQERTLANVRSTSARLERELIERERTLAVLEVEVSRRRQLERESLEVAERERRRVGRELHDGICQQLTAGHLAARLLERELQSRQAPELGEVERLVEILETALADSRGLARGLNPQPLPAGKLGSALGDLARQVRETVEVDCDFKGSEVPALSSQWVTQLFRIAQEATWNAVKHAEATRITLELGQEPDGIRLSVRDDGNGLAVGAPEGLGMRSMSGRARNLGGELRVQSQPGKGTLVSCLVPSGTKQESA